ncbi:Pepsin-2B [Grifola frondosa]|uniref:Pepsin-2B n=1 Tax=Grifola frondosa TaxID=5627 RepID=A0A1C7LXK1_GRIFR|nr:Pepsin-2B [Grifola frondosa]
MLAVRGNTGYVMLPALSTPRVPRRTLDDSTAGTHPFSYSPFFLFHSLPSLRRSPAIFFKMFTSSWCALFLVVLPALVSALPLRPSEDRTITKKRRLDLPLERRRITERSDVVGGTVGLGDIADLFYTVAVKVGNSTTAVNLDTGSSDLWVMSSACQTQACKSSTATPYSTTTFSPVGSSVNLLYGDSTSGTHAAGPVGRDTVVLAGLSMPNQTLAAVNDTNNSAVSNGGAGIMGLGFPAQSFVQAAVVNAQFNNPSGTDEFVLNTPSDGPLVSRLAIAGAVEEPMFAITLQRDTIDVSGHGQISIGQLPAGVDNSTITWVPVRLYSPANGGMQPPSFAANEIYPLRWEVVLDGVYLDGQKLANSTQQGQGVSSTTVSALIDTGNSILRGPSDVVTNILRTVSPAFAADTTADDRLARRHTRSRHEQQRIDVHREQPRRDGPAERGCAVSWSLGDPFLKSTMVVFYYGNLTHPSLDPPRMGFLSLVPADAGTLLEQAVQDAQQDGGVFESRVDVAPTASSIIDASTSGVSSPASQTPTGASSATSSSFSTTPSTSSSSSPSASETNSKLRIIFVPSAERSVVSDLAIHNLYVILLHSVNGSPLLLFSLNWGL